MPRIRHTVQIEAREANLIVRSLALGLPDGYEIEGHTHSWPQLVYGTRGVMTVNTELGTWVAPSQRAVWVPAGVEHSLRTTGRVAVRTLYLRSDLAANLPQTCSVMGVSPFLRELILEIVARDFLDERDPGQLRLARVLMDQLFETREMPLELAYPKDPRALAVARRVHAAPGCVETLAQLARNSGASPRTLERIFQRETGMSFGRWRQQVRLLEALRRLASGATVSAVALDVGYESASAFIAMFKRTLGTTPRRYFDTA